MICRSRLDLRSPSAVFTYQIYQIPISLDQELAPQKKVLRSMTCRRPRPLACGFAGLHLIKRDRTIRVLHAWYETKHDEAGKEEAPTVKVMHFMQII